MCICVSVWTRTERFLYLSQGVRECDKPAHRVAQGAVTANTVQL